MTTRADWYSKLITEKRKADRERERPDSNPKPPGYYSNRIIRQRNGGVRHQFEDDIGGCSANYR